MFRLFSFLLYGLAVLVGVAGLLVGGVPLVEYLVKRLAGDNLDAYLILSSYDRFSAEVMVILSLMLLILVQIGHALTGASHSQKSGKTAALQGRLEDPLRSPPIGPGRQSPGPERTPSAAKPDQADEKLAPLLKQGKG